MDPLTISSAAPLILSLVDWKKVAQSLATDAAGKGAKSLLGRLKPDPREKTARDVLDRFTREFLAELEDKTDLSASLPGYRDQLKRLVEHAAPDITGCLRPDTKDVDLAPVMRMWTGLGLDPLPQDFDWTIVAKNFSRALRFYIKEDAALRETLNTTLLEQQADAARESAQYLAQIAGIAPGFDVAAYRDYLRKKCAVLHLSAMHTSTYERRINLWTVFVPQTAREAIPVRDLPRDLLRRLREEGHLTAEFDEVDSERRVERYRSSPISPVLDTIARNRLVVVLGDPGAGKTSLLKFLVMRWIDEDTVDGAPAPFPVWIDLKEYAQDRNGLLQYCESGCATFGLDCREVEKFLKAGTASLYVDGLDEIFDAPTRGSVVEELAAVAARYPNARIVVTSRILGYEPDRLSNAGFLHATLEDFDDDQIRGFLAKWHDAAEDDPKQRARLVDQLDRALGDSPAVRALAGNPLLLTMMAILNRTQALPRDRVELYAQASRVLLHEWDASRSLPVDTFGRQEKEDLLRELAGEMQQSDAGLAGNLIDRDRLIAVFRRYLDSLGVTNPHEKALSLVRQLTERNFILCFAGADRFSFVHRTFLEYYCASWFVRAYEKKRALSFDQLRDEVFGRHWHDQTWHEVLRLIAGMIDEKPAEELIRFLMRQKGWRHQYTNMLLAAGCLGEIRNRQAVLGLSEELRQEFTRNMIRRSSAGQLPAIALIASVWRSDETRDWLKWIAEGDSDERARSAAIRVLANEWSGDPDTFPWLREQLRFEESAPVAELLLRNLARRFKDHPDTVGILRGAIDTMAPVVGAAAVEELARGWDGDPEIGEHILELARSAHHAEVRQAAIEDLANRWKHTPDALEVVTAYAQSSSSPLRASALQALARAWSDAPGTLPLVISSAENGLAPHVRQTAIDLLATRWRQHAGIPAILRAAAGGDPSPQVRALALRMLARHWKNDPEIQTFIKNRICSEDAGVLGTVIAAVAESWGQSAELSAWLRDRLLAHPDANVRLAAVRSLARVLSRWDKRLTVIQAQWQAGEPASVRPAALLAFADELKDDPAALRIVKELAQNGDELLRGTAQMILAEYWPDDSSALEIVKAAARDPRSAPFWALQSLAANWPDDPETAGILKDAARLNPDHLVRALVGLQLSETFAHDPDTRTVIMDMALREPEEVVPTCALDLLAGRWRDHPATLPFLHSLARDPDRPEVRSTIARALARGWRHDPATLPLLKELGRTDPAPKVRASATEALRRLWRDDPEVREMLAAQAS